MKEENKLKKFRVVMRCNKIIDYFYEVEAENKNQAEELVWREEGLDGKYLEPYMSEDLITEPDDVKVIEEINQGGEKK